MLVRSSLPIAIASGYGSGLAVNALSPSTTPLPITLGGTTVSVQDANGALRLGQLFYAGPGQVNFLVPAATGVGTAQVTVTSATGDTSLATVDISAVRPSIFTMPGGTVAAAVAVRVAEDASQTPVAVFQCTSATSCTASPIDIGGAGHTVFLTVFGTGLRKNSGLANVHATIGGVDSPVLFAGAQGQFDGLDQLNVQVPTALRGKGEVPVIFTIDGQTSNTVTIRIHRRLVEGGPPGPRGSPWTRSSRRPPRPMQSALSS